MAVVKAEVGDATRVDQIKLRSVFGVGTTRHPLRQVSSKVDLRTDRLHRLDRSLLGMELDRVVPRVKHPPLKQHRRLNHWTRISPACIQVVYVGFN